MALKNSNIVILIQCQDKKGIVAAVSGFISQNNGNILDCKQHVDSETGTYFMRVLWDPTGFLIPRNEIAGYFSNLVATPYEMTFQLFDLGVKPRLAIMVSKYFHCLIDILGRYISGEWDVEIPLVVSNHPDAGEICEKFGIGFHYIPVTKENKPQAEARLHRLLQENKVDLIVLARYMQILSGDFVEKYPDNIINIHHSFLPAFPGSKPYHSAHQRGVKLIGATSHYVTEDLDEGPIVEQGVVHVSHEDSVADFVRHGRDLEKVVLSKAVFHHINHRIIVDGNRTVVL